METSAGFGPQIGPAAPGGRHVIETTLPRAASALLLAVGIAAFAWQPARAGQAAPQQASGQPAADTPKEPTAGEKYKNVQVLKDMPVSQFDDAMVYLGAATGQNCEGCHVRTPDGVWQHDKDDKDHKTISRTMLQMVKAINAQHFKGEPTVTCATCHQGRREPNALTPLSQPMTADQIAMAQARAQAGPRPQPPTETVDQIVGKYIAAAGGREALQKIATRTMKGTVTTRSGQTVPYAVEERASGAYRSTAVASPALTITKVFDGTAGWIRAGKDVADYTGVEFATLSRSSDLGFPLQIGERLTRLAVGRYEKIDGQDVVSVTGTASAGVTEILYFDRASGLLVRRVARIATALGQIPIQLDFSGYRKVDGVMVPFQIRQTTWDAVMTATFTDVALNAPVDDAVFRK
jgi:hypothetical protein